MVDTRAVRQPWEYESLRVPLDGDAVPRLNAAGLEGWEPTGLAFPNGNEAIIVMKRPK